MFWEHNFYFAPTLLSPCLTILLMPSLKLQGYEDLSIHLIATPEHADVLPFHGNWGHQSIQIIVTQTYRAISSGKLEDFFQIKRLAQAEFPYDWEQVQLRVI